MQGTTTYGMQTFDQSLLSHYRKGLITYDTALRYSTNPDDFKLRVQGIQSTSDTAKEEMDKNAGLGSGEPAKEAASGASPDDFDFSFGNT